MEDTIVAISTAVGTGGIGIIRLSGENCFDVLGKIFIPKNKEKGIKGYTIKYGKIVENDITVDEVLVSFFVSPFSYTKENMCEINSHGGIVVLRRILELCLKNGARLAQPGEFTKRAFLNGRIDLSQAEAVIDLINSKSDIEAKESALQLEGRLSREILNIQKYLYDAITSIEVTIDYPEYDIEEVDDDNIMLNLKKARENLDYLISTFDNGKIIKNGVKTVILGRPNAGKSSLMNLILDEDRAIVSSIEGTTRDTIEEFVNIQGIELKLIDTAGIRESDNEIEKIGVDKARKLAKEADLIIAIFDISRKPNGDDDDIINLIKDKKAIVLLNKIDLEKSNQVIEEKIKNLKKPVIRISAKENIGIDKLYSETIKMFNLGDFKPNSQIVVTNERHKNLIMHSKESISDAINAIEKDIPIDICSVYIKDALESLAEILGENVSEKIIEEIFKNFCLGK